MKLALISADGLGDATIQLIISQNLSKLGHDVIYYQGLLSHIDTIVSDVDIKHTSELTATTLINFDWLLVDKGCEKLPSILGEPSLKIKTLVYSISKTKPDPKFRNTQIPMDGSANSKLLQTFNAQCLRKGRTIGTIVDQLQHIFEHDIGLHHADSQVNLQFPKDWKQRRFEQRVVIHPTSSNDSKNWTPSQFLSLADKISDHGFEPVFTVAPFERDQWLTLTRQQFACPHFETIRELAHYYYESAYFIGNDSGNGHLASLLGLPTISIFNTRKRQLSWRPAWGENHIIHPILSRRLVGKQHWKKTVSADKILSKLLLLKERQR